MNSDFQKLDWFESATIGLMAFGIVLIGVIFFYALPEQGQIEVKKSVAFLDVSDQIDAPIKTIYLVLETPNIYLNEFYLAFNETMALPVDIESVAKNINSLEQEFIALSDYFGQVYEEQYTPSKIPGPIVQMAVGRVLGAVIDSGDRVQGIGFRGQEVDNTYQETILSSRASTSRGVAILPNDQTAAADGLAVAKGKSPDSQTSTSNNSYSSNEGTSNVPEVRSLESIFKQYFSKLTNLSP